MEMERDCLLAHGVSATIQETMCRQSDRYEITVCEKCGNICSLPKECRVCKKGVVNRVEMPYCAKLLTQELQALGVGVRIATKK
jgi:DNA-directed RNA polymerase II subunit RPB2